MINFFQSVLIDFYIYVVALFHLGITLIETGRVMTQKDLKGEFIMYVLLTIILLVIYLFLQFQLQGK